MVQPLTTTLWNHFSLTQFMQATFKYISQAIKVTCAKQPYVETFGGQYKQHTDEIRDNKSRTVNLQEQYLS